MALNCAGIDFSDIEGSWTKAPVVEMDIELPFARQDVAVQLNADPFLVPKVLSVQQVFIFMGGLFVGFCSLRGHSRPSFPVNRSSVSGRTTRLSMTIPTATSPRALGLSDDERQLGIYLTSMTFLTV